MVEKRSVESRNNYSWKTNFFKNGFLVLCFSKSRAIYSFLRFFWPYSFVFGGWTRRIIFFRKHGNAWFLLVSSSQLRLVMLFLAFLWGIVAFLSILLRFKWFVTPHSDFSDFSFHSHDFSDFLYMNLWYDFLHHWITGILSMINDNIHILKYEYFNINNWYWKRS